MPLTAADAEALAVLRHQYFQLLDLALLRWPDPSVLKQADAQSWLFETMFDRDAVRYCPPERYQVRVLKQLIARIESAIDNPEEDVGLHTGINQAVKQSIRALKEISDDLMSSLSVLLSSSLPSEASAAQKKSYVTYDFGLSRAVTLLESRNVIASSGTTGLGTWDAALHLGAYLSTSTGSEWVRGKRILELGAGTGLLSILSTKHLDAAQATATDGDEGVVDAIKTNLFLNELDGKNTDAVVLRWGRTLSGTIYYDGDDKDSTSNDQYDVILGADVTYDRFAIPRLVSTLDELLERQPKLDVLIAATIRNEQTFEAFNVASSRHRLRLADVPFTPSPVSTQTGPFYTTATPMRILHVTRAAAAPAARADAFALSK
ncbi:hypothetical protein K490DRAFT_49959 [Saccharata proteae CBS 121410]|uniref:Uncharacterized protein n=1 Tax=Saccharata proteae CBS 121410 TaxID=1314787 RepID=A0A9P4LS14_9PEZI|nr:hypothetical protein K490DRAFT_49959 [Saccharata proteae CBS 121410]